MNTPTAWTEGESRRTDLEALERELGLVGMIRYLQERNPGSGDYTAERSAWLDKITLDDLASMVAELRQQDTEAQR
jgi:hypothetical protein